MPFLARHQLESMGFRYLGREVKLSDKASIYNASAIAIGDFSRIDDYCVLSAGSGGISIGRNVHIAVYCSLIGAERIELQDFSGLSSRVSIYSSNDDYSGNSMTNPTVPSDYTHVTSLPVILQRHAIVGSGTIILPGVNINKGAAIAALSLIKRDCEAFGIYSGIPAKRIGTRSDGLMDQEARYLQSEKKR